MFHDGFGDGDWGHPSGPHTDAIGHSLGDICELVLDAQVLGCYLCHSRKIKVIQLITELHFKVAGYCSVRTARASNKLRYRNF